ncbi:hypothetical protein A2801_03750 [Candidatus Woesebacteria bacterium RIFCSPHIGHO2_01_FULL_41_10]|uniref:Uncharacterized protein n=1 Tax=Candidatus Woesebacteria bacterium RIFCSPHIGHO2_01_FULL_41_10 TaxID=1802500 RepID=A0A1F7YMH1_9BACT|nr:MAG: hypothetical protein A2801_03750 [Candidatus Woesebacteria bacterium RIFCSPHIGHO2_01_FULL_41_10]
MKIKLAILGVVAFLFASVSSVSASEGVTELRNIVGEDSRCVAYSVLMENNKFTILLNCRDILYPGGTSILHYVVWTQPIGGGNPLRMGTVGLGKKEFATSKPFSGIFVTKESSSSPKSPQGPVMMQGNVRSSELLETRTEDRPVEINTEESTDETQTPSPTAEPQRSSLGTRLLVIGGIVAFLALFGVVLVIFVITRR